MEKLDMFSGYEKLVKPTLAPPQQEDSYELFGGSDEDVHDVPPTTQQVQAPPANAGMSEDDMNKIALKVAELLKAGKEE